MVNTGSSAIGSVTLILRMVVLSKTLDGIITSWNQGATLIFGYEAAEMIGKPITTLSRNQVARQIAFLPQETRSDFAFTVRELVTI